MTRIPPDSYARGLESGTDPEMLLEDPEARVEGRCIGPWLLLERLDAGSYGIVYRARRADREDSPPVAVKVARKPADYRFEREVEALQRVQHPNLPKLEGHGEWTDPEARRHSYIVMELVQGLPLYAWAHVQRPTSRQYLRVLAQVAQALAALHAEGVMHRDVKGDNIVVTPEGRAVLLDLGCCWLPGAKPLTDSAMPPGTTPYRPPAMLRFAWRFRRDMNARYESEAADDLYSLGVTGYKALTGTYPPPPTESEESRSRITPPTQWCTCAPELEALVMRMLADGKAERGTAAGLAEALETAAQGGEHLDRRVELGAAALPTEEGSPPQSSSGSGSKRQSSEASRPRSVALPLWFSWAGAGMLGGLVVLGGAGLWRVPGSAPTLVTEERHMPPVDAPDAGVGEEVLLSFAQTPNPISSTSSVGLPMPKAPAPAQKKPPLRAAIRGGRPRSVLGRAGCSAALRDRRLRIRREVPPCDLRRPTFAHLGRTVSLRLGRSLRSLSTPRNSWARAAMVAGVVVLGGVRLLRMWGAEPMSGSAERRMPPEETPGAGVGIEALDSAEDFPRVGGPSNGLGRPMPKQPFPGQRKPPCEERGEKAINGACWVGVGDEKPPCGPKMFDHEDRCYLPSYDAPRQPASEKQ